jgi:hypothetical protein
MRKTILTALALWLMALSSVFGQYTTSTTNAKKNLGKVYSTSWADGVITVAGMGVSYWGLTIMNDKEPLSQEYLDWVAMNPEEAKAGISKFDRWTAGNFNDEVSKLTDIPFYGSFALPFVVAASSDKTRKDFLQISLLYVETMSITGSLYTHSAGWINRNRPLVYNADPENDDRADIKATNSFFAGHTAATASATFFAAKVYNDYFPKSRAKPLVWAGAAIIPALVGYGRLEAGKHFMSDNLVGYALGASIGILVPHLHKVSRYSGFTIMPFTGPYDGFAFNYRF